MYFTHTHNAAQGCVLISQFENTKQNSLVIKLTQRYQLLSRDKVIEVYVVKFALVFHLIDNS